MSEKKILKVFDQEGLYKTMAVEPRTASGEICEKFSKKLFLNETDRVQFSLYIIEGGVKQKLKPTDFPFDYLVKLENKTDYKFYFLNPNGDYISFNPDKTKSTTTTSTSTGSSGNNSPNLNGANKPPSKSVSIRPGKGMSGILLRKRANRFEEIWAVSKDKYLRIYESEDDTDTALFELSLENAVIELKPGGNSGSAQIILTLSNSERHTFTSDKDSDINAWATELQCTTAYTASQTSKVATPAMAFIPTARDLNVKLQSKLENNEVQGRVIIAYCNYLLNGRQIKITEDIMTAFSDGHVLINLIDILFGKTLKYRKGKSIYEMQYNVDACLDTLRDAGADFGKMISQDIVECKVIKVVLRLLWSIFVAFVTNGEKEYQLKDKIVGWAGRKVHEFNKSLSVDSASSLQNPLIFAALLAKYNPSAIDYNSVSSKKSKEEQAKIVLDAAFEKSSIPKILEPSYFKEDSQDEKAYLLYLSLYYYTFSNEDKPKADIVLLKSQEPTQAVEPENTLSARDKVLKQQQQQNQEENAKKEKERLEKEVKEREFKERLEKEEKERLRIQLEKERKEREEREEQEREEREREEREREEREEQEREEQERIDREKEELERLQKERELEKQFEDQQREQRERESLLEDERIKNIDDNNNDNIDESDDDKDVSFTVTIPTINNNVSTISNLQYDEDDEDGENLFNNNNKSTLSTLSSLSSSSTISAKPLSHSSSYTQSPNTSSSDLSKEYASRKFTKPLPQPVTQPSSPPKKQQVRQPSVVEEVEEFGNVEQYDAISPDKSNNYSTSNVNNNENSSSDLSNASVGNSNNNDGGTSGEKPISRAICRICLEGFGEVLFCSFAIGSDTLCGKVRQMVIKKMKVPKEEEPEYFLYIVRDGLERVLDDDEILLEAEDKVDRFVFKKNDIERKYLLSNHRGN